MKYYVPLLLALTIFISSSQAITADVYGNANCTGAPLMSFTYTLNVCKDMTQQGFSVSINPTICNATFASISTWLGSSSCSGNPSTITTGVPGTCMNDGTGSYSKIVCNSASPSSPTIKSSASTNSFNMFLGTMIVMIVLIVGILF